MPIKGFTVRPLVTPAGFYELVDTRGRSAGQSPSAELLEGTVAFLEGRSMPVRTSERERVEAAAHEARLKRMKERAV